MRTISSARSSEFTRGFLQEDVLLRHERGEVVEQGCFVVLDEQVAGVAVVVEHDSTFVIEPGAAVAGFGIGSDVGEI